MKHNEWFTERVGTDSVNAAAKKSELPQASLFTHLKRGTLPAESVIKISRAYDYNPVQGLVDTGYLAIDEAQGEVKIVNWDDVSDVALCEQILYRTKLADKEGRATVLSEPLNDETTERVLKEAAKEERPTLRAVQTPVRGIPVIEEVDPERFAANETDYDIDAEIEHHLDTP